MNYIILPPSGNSAFQKFGVRFCQSFISRELSARRIWRLDSKEPVWKDVRQYCSDGEGAILIHPLVIACHSALKSMETIAGKAEFEILGPLMSGGRPEQAPSLPFTYQDMESFREASDWLSKKCDCAVRKTEDLNTEMYFCSPGFVRMMPDSLPISETGNHETWKNASKGSIENALAHTFTGYYSHARGDLAELIPHTAESVMDVGCGAGELGRYLKDKRPRLRTFGLEEDPEVAKIASRNYHRVFVGDAEKIEIPTDFDCIVCGDVIEHFANPWAVLSRLNSLLKPDGLLVGSCPNSGHWSVVKGLLEGRYVYIPAGILCWDHIRHFTEMSLRSLLADCGFEPTMLRKEKPAPSPRGVTFLEEIAHYGLADMESLTTAEFVFTAGKKA